MRRGGRIERRTRLKRRREQPRRRPEGVIDRAHLDAVKAIGVCYWAEIWIPRRVTQLHALHDPERRADEIADFAARVKKWGACRLPFDPDHTADEDRGLGQKPPDRSAVCVCRGHHDQREDWSGIFRGVSRFEMAAARLEAVRWTLARLGRQERIVGRGGMF